MAALEAAMRVKSFPVIPSRTSLHNHQHVDISTNMLLLHSGLVECDVGRWLNCLDVNRGGALSNEGLRVGYTLFAELRSWEAMFE